MASSSVFPEAWIPHSLQHLRSQALGPDHVYGLILPEKESSPSSRELAIKLCKKLKIPYGEVPITPMLESFNIYNRKAALLRELFPLYDPKIHTTNLFLPPGIASQSLLALPSIRLSDKNGSLETRRLSAPQYRNLISLQNVKQRTRMIALYMQAEKMNYSVSGTTNKSELLTGYFVKFGDGGVDIEPIADMYKLQVYKLSEMLNIDKNIISRAPSPDTWSHFTSDEDFYLRMPYDILDQLLYAEEHDIPMEIVLKNTGSHRRPGRVGNKTYSHDEACFTDAPVVAPGIYAAGLEMCRFSCWYE